MEKIDLSTNSKQILELYNKVVRGNGTTTYGVFSVDKSGVLSATTNGTGDLSEFVTEFNDGQVQFGLARVTVPGSDVTKNLLLGWCPDNAPAKLRLSFASNFADVSKVLSGYHIQLTARDQDDLDADEFVSRVGAAAGARYLIQTATKSSFTNTPAPKAVTPSVKKPVPAPVSQPTFVPKSTGKPLAPITPRPTLPKPKLPASNIASKSSSNEDEWGGEKEITERDFETQPLEDVPSAYKPTKVDIAELRKQKSDTISSKAATKAVDPEVSEEKMEPKSLSDRMNAYQLAGNEGRLTSLPKPKVNHSVTSRYAPIAVSDSKPSFGSKPQIGTVPSKNDKVIGGLSRNFAAENGKTPAQIWAEKRGQYVVVPTDENSTGANPKEDGESSLIESKVDALTIADENEVTEAFTSQTEEDVEVSEPETPEPTPVAVPTPPKLTLPEAPKESKSVEEDSVPANVPSLPSRALPAPPVPQEAEASVTAENHNASIKAVAQFDYEKDEDNEVEFLEGDEIVDIEFVDEEWWSGKNSRTGQLGLFPGSYVTIDPEVSKSLESEEATPVAEAEPNVSAGKSALAEYDYAKDEDNEIAFAEGDLIVEIDFVDEDWWSGKHSKTGEVGLFPANYVKLQ